MAANASGVARGAWRIFDGIYGIRGEAGKHDQITKFSKLPNGEAGGFFWIGLIGFGW